MSQTQATLVGTVVNDPYRRYTADGAPFIKFRMACNDRRFDKATQEWVDGDSLFVNVTCWRRLVKGVGAGLGKGDPVIVVGRLYTHEWTDKDTDGRRSSLQLDAAAVGPDLARCITMIDNSRKSGPTADQAEQAEELIEEVVTDAAEDAAAPGALV